MDVALLDEIAEDVEFTETLQNLDFLQDVLRGLSLPIKQLSPKYFYDDIGSSYFDEICNLSDYYPYKTEIKLLKTVAKDLRKLIPSTQEVVEFGAGSQHKIRPLLDQLPQLAYFTPIDISRQHLMASTAHLQEEYAHILMRPTVADFVQFMDVQLATDDVLGFFPGSTIGNFTPEQARSFLNNVNRTLGKNAHLLIGVDTKKSPAVLHNAYNDQSGVTAGFNKNVLTRINRELDGDFNLDNFQHYAYYNPRKGRIEMHLISTCAQTVVIKGIEIKFLEGETIHTENSYKYTAEGFASLAKSAGWRVSHSWFADENMFGIYLLSPVS